MDPQLLSIHYADPLWLAIAFICGLAIKMVGLPPLIGFLLAGFLLNALGAEGGEFLSAAADLGITLLLFSIGLKLKLKTLARPEVLGVASLHMIVVTFLLSVMIFFLSYSSLPLVSGLDFKTAALIGFAMSFSSTVFAVKILDELGASASKHGQVAIGVLVIQDIAAVAFIAISLGKLPSLWALALILLIPLRFLLYWTLDRISYGELLILFGITLALVGADVFELVGIKEDVGALVFGMLLANHPKAGDLAKNLLGFKDLFLVGFFLSVGMTTLPDWNSLLIASLFIIFLPLKVAMYFGLFSRFHLRASTSWRTALNLGNYSEFGLIVGAIAVTTGWLEKEWLAVFAVVLSLSFMLAAPFVNTRDSLYQKLRSRLIRFERPGRLSGEEDLNLTNIKVAVFGMGRMGTAAYNALETDYKDSLIGVEINKDKVDSQHEAGRNVVVGDATNPDFWIRAPDLLDSLKWVLSTLPTHQANINATLRLKEFGYSGRIAATTKYHEEEEQLKSIGVDYTFNIYTEAGLGFAKDLRSSVAQNPK